MTLDQNYCPVCGSPRSNEPPPEWTQGSLTPLPPPPARATAQPQAASSHSLSSRSETNGLAVASLVLGVIGAVLSILLGGIIFGVPALICAYKARRQMAKTGQQGASQSMAGIVLGWISVAISGVVAIAVGFGIYDHFQHPSSGSFYATLYGVQIQGEPVTIATTRMADPARATDGSNCDSGSGTTCNHYATIRFDITNTGSSSIDDFSSYSITITGSDGNVYQSSDAGGTQICPYSNSSVTSLSPGQTASQCASWVLPSNVTVASVEFSGSGSSSTGTVTWTNAPDTFGGWRA